MSNYGIIRSLGKEIFEFGTGKNLRKFIRYTENGKNWTQVLDHDGKEILRYSKKVTKQNVGDKFVYTKSTERVNPSYTENIEQARVYDQNKNLLGGRTTIEAGGQKVSNRKWAKGKWSSKLAYSEDGKRVFKGFGNGSPNATTNRDFLYYNAHGLPIPNLLAKAKGSVEGVNKALEVLQRDKYTAAYDCLDDVYSKTLQRFSQHLKGVQDCDVRVKMSNEISSMAKELAQAKAAPLFEEAHAVNSYGMNNVRDLYSQVRDNILLKQPIADAVEKLGKDILSGKMFRLGQHLNG